MGKLRIEHFQRSASDIAAHGDNDTLPFDVDNVFIRENQRELAEICARFAKRLDAAGKKGAAKRINSLQIFSERLLAPSGPSGFRITTKIHPFWNVYLNGIGVAIAEAHEPRRSARAHSYRFSPVGESLFDKSASWRLFRTKTVEDCETAGPEAVVVQTDISNFYEHAYHHRIENLVADLFPEGSTIATQLDRLLAKFSSGRSFGLPVGGQCARIVAEVLMSAIDTRLTEEGVVWRRYVDDFVLLAESKSDAYRALSVLSHTLADYGLTLNRSKTTFLAVGHYIDYVRTQLGGTGDDASKLREIDLYFDPYSDNAESNYEDLKESVRSIEMSSLLQAELDKAQPDTFVVSQISRTLRLQRSEVAIETCRTLLSSGNLHAFRASWATIMRSVAAMRDDKIFSKLFSEIDRYIDEVPRHSLHLLSSEANRLHFLRVLRAKRTDARAAYVLSVYKTETSETVKRACIECWRSWGDRGQFTSLRNTWQKLSPEQQRTYWLAAGKFADEGVHFRNQVHGSLEAAWALGIEPPARKQAEEKKGRLQKPPVPHRTFASLYVAWASNG